jgi:hypothetical protein
MAFTVAFIPALLAGWIVDKLTSPAANSHRLRRPRRPRRRPRARDAADSPAVTPQDSPTEPRGPRQVRPGRRFPAGMGRA